MSLWKQKISYTNHISKLEQFCKVFNGVLLRAAQDAKLDQDNRKTKFAKPDIIVGFIPGGNARDKKLLFF